MSARLQTGAYYGQKVAQAHMAGLHLSECLYSPDVEIPEHSHENPYFILVLSGSQNESFGGENRSYSRATLALHPAHECHSQKVGPEGLRCLHVEFSSAWIGRHESIGRLLQQQKALNSGPVPRLASQIYHEFEHKDDLSWLVVEGLVFQVIAEVSRTGLPGRNNNKDWLKKVRDHIHDHCTEPFSLSSLAESAGVHPTHLARQFKREYKLSIGQYIRKLRIEAACSALIHSEKPITEIALSHGFSDQAHFTRSFKKVTQQTPGNFRSRFSR